MNDSGGRGSVRGVWARGFKKVKTQAMCLQTKDAGEVSFTDTVGQINK